ncbi:MAG: methyltransferase [Candidatus Aenigmarchaeota archaeon]|nr:methyltransferase [Candidatus Aenigmarchaeota archaeon]
METKIYPPNEDSYFLIDCLKKEIGNRRIKTALEIGTGSGIVSFSIASFVDKILAVDINPKAIEFAQEKAELMGLKNIEFRVSNLFENVSGKFDLIFFNPPYLPGRGDLSCTGGKRGQEIIEKFLSEVCNYLNEGGEAIILLSSFNRYKELEKKFGLKLIGKNRLWFESLYCYKYSEKTE